MPSASPEVSRLIEEIGARSPDRQLSTGDLLCRVGDDSTDAFIVRSGVLEALVPVGDAVTTAAVHEAGALVGEVSTVVGGPRTATLRAKGQTVVSVVSKADLGAWLDRNPQGARTILGLARERTDRNRAAGMLHGSLGIEDHSLAVLIAEKLAIESVPAGTELAIAGEPGEAAGLLISGRVATDGSTEEHGRGHIVGLGSLFGDDARGTVRTTRDATIGWLRRDDFAELVATRPLDLVDLVRRLSSEDRPGGAGLGRSIAVVTDGPDGGDLFRTMVGAVEQRSSVLGLDADTIDRLLDTPGIADRGRGEPGERRVDELLHQAEVDHDVVLLHVTVEQTAVEQTAVERTAGDPGTDPTRSQHDGWLDRAIRYADQVVVWTDRPTSIELADRVRSIRHVASHARIWLAIRHPDGTGLPTDTATLRRRLGVDEIHHTRHDRLDDVERVGRLSAGVGVGLVLSGGGGRGFAHIGAIRSLRERGVPIDRIAGASMGSAIAGMAGMGHDGDDLIRLVERQFHNLLDYTIPLVSVLSGKRIASNIDATFGGADVEDLWIPFACVSTNLTRNRTEFHRSGSLATAIRASVAIPGILPPVPRGGDLLIDGGVLDNLPLDLLSDDPSIGTLIAVDVAPPRGPRAKVDFGSSVSGWSAFRDRFLRPKSRLPTLGSVLMRTMTVGSSRQRDEWLSRDTADLYLYLNLSGVGLLDFENVRPVVERGYEAADPEIEAWLAGTRAPADDADHADDVVDLRVTNGAAPSVPKPEPARH